ncbi:hypothetical protein [Streptomyces europaeiscabiei]|uniref:hypothetical protein n=1 Tax=Streptomyces europaeiscabiei TaxID=146819 RepID=UPI002E171E5C
MPRDRTPRFVLALAALLVGLQFLAMMPGGSGPVAYGSAPAFVEQSTDVVVAAHATELAPCQDVGRIAGLKSWSAGRDRRHAVKLDVERSGAGVHEDECIAAPPGGLMASHLASRFPAGGSLASLQLLRC